ncbi:MAG: hypothetical protein KBC96_05885 [Armatimonadetes bacterium]|nr:hypothetical protein [Armatimonadota bacterium]
MTRSIVLLLCISTLACLAGCGGGGGSATLPLENVTRQMLPGDQYTYDITGTATDGLETIDITGTWQDTWSAQTTVAPDLTVCHIHLNNITLAAEGLAPIVFTGRSYEYQDAAGCVWDYGGDDDDGVFWVDVPLAGRDLRIPSPMYNGTSWGGYCHYTNGKSSNNAYVVVGTETISVPAGRFETFRITSSGSFSGYPAIGMYWYAPHLSTAVKQELQVSFTDEGFTMNLTMVLTGRTRSAAVSADVRAHSEQVDLGEWMKQLFEN